VDFECKWNDQSPRYQNVPERFPSNLDGPEAERVRQTALAAYHAMRCRDYGRIDLRLRDGLPYVVDVNPNCDITREGGFAQTAKVAGYDYGAMASQIVSWASARRPPERTRQASCLRSRGRPV
jgi:D-alanine-D-alanine ligase